MTIPFTELNPPERKRTYYFPSGPSLTVNDVTHIEVRQSGKHRLQCKNGDKVFVAPNWNYIIVDVDEWTI